MQAILAKSSAHTSVVANKAPVLRIINRDLIRNCHKNATNIAVDQVAAPMNPIEESENDDDDDDDEEEESEEQTGEEEQAKLSSESSEEDQEEDSDSSPQSGGNSQLRRAPL